MTPASVAPLVTLAQVKPTFAKGQQVSQVVLTFSGAVNQADAANRNLYHLSLAGKNGLFTARDARVLAIKAVTYQNSNFTITLVPKLRFSVTRPVQLQISGQPSLGLHDISGRLIDGNHDGQPGGDASAVLSKNGSIRIAARRFQPSH